MVHIYNGILFSHKKEQNNVICSSMDGPRGYHIDWNKPYRERQILYAVIYMWNLKSNTNESVYKTETDSQTQKTNLWLSKEKKGTGIN